MISETNHETSERLLNVARSLGFNKVHLLGGTRADGLYYSGSIVYKYDPIVKEMFFLGVPYNSNYHLTGESGHNKKSDENPEQTAIRELMEEAGLHAFPEDLVKVYEKTIPDNRPGKNGQFHSKYFFLVEKYTGQVFEFDGPNPIDGETAAPIWFSASMFVTVLFGGHLKPLQLAIEKLMEKNRDYAHALMNVCI